MPYDEPRDSHLSVWLGWSGANDRAGEVAPADRMLLVAPTSRERRWLMFSVTSIAGIRGVMEPESYEAAHVVHRPVALAAVVWAALARRPPTMAAAVSAALAYKPLALAAMI